MPLRRSANIRLEPLKTIETAEEPGADIGFVASARWTLRRTDLLRAMWVHPDWAKWLAILAVGLYFTAPIARTVAPKLILAFGVHDNPPMVQPIVYAVLAVAPLLGFVLFVLNRLRHQLASTGFGEDHQLDATPEALRYAVGAREGEIAWSALRRVHPVPGYLLLRFSSRDDLLVPRRAFVQHDGGASFLAAVASRAGDVIARAPVPRREETPGSPMWRRIGMAIVMGLIVLGAVRAAMVYFTLKS